MEFMTIKIRASSKAMLYVDEFGRSMNNIHKNNNAQFDTIIVKEVKTSKIVNEIWILAIK